MVKIGVIGGSGLDDPDIFKNMETIEVETEFGAPTSPIKKGVINGKEVCLIARHGNKHQFSPSRVNYRANIKALKDMNVTHILATTACGSLKLEIERGDFVILDQFIDFTKFRKNTFFESFEEGARHTAMPDPFDAQLRDILYQTAVELDFKTHKTGTVVTIEGPRFSTRAESHMFRSFDADVVNMSVATEAVLANEAEIPYAAVAMSTDYDCWKHDEVPVSWEEILEVFHKNVDRVTTLLVNAVPKIQ